MDNLAQITQILANLSILTFVVAGMAALGLQLTIRQIVDPLRSVSLLVKALLANFVLVPALAYVLKFVIPMDDSFGIGLILLATAAGAPFLPKLVQVAKGDVAMSVGVMVLLMVVTVAYVPIALPLLLAGVQVNPWDIASSLIVLMLVPLAIGLFIRARYVDLATGLQPTMAQISNVGLMLGFVALLLLNLRTLLGTIGSGAILALLLLVAGSLVIGWFLGGSTRPPRTVMGLGTAQRNVSAALVVAGGNFDDPNVLVMCMLGAIVMLAVLMVTAGELGKRTGAEGDAEKVSA